MLYILAQHRHIPMACGGVNQPKLARHDVTPSLPANQHHGCLSPTGSFQSIFDLLTSSAKMKRINSPADDNIPIYIFILLFAILLFSFLATTDFKRPKLD